MSKLLRDCTLEELEQQKQQLIDSGDINFRFYHKRMNEIVRCINLLNKNNE